MKKPKVWDIAVLTGIALMVIMLLMKGGRSASSVNMILIVYFACAICMLIYAFFRQLKYNMYSYNTIYYAGFALFLQFLMSSHIRLAVAFNAEEGDMSITEIISNLQGSGRMFILISFPFIFLFSAALCISNISLVRHEGRRIVNLLGIAAAFMMTGGAVFLFITGRYISGSMEYVLRMELINQLLCTVYLYCECMLIGAIIADIIAAAHEPAPDKNFIVILGCGFRSDGTPTPLLRGRIDRAIEFYEKQRSETGREPVFIASGGQGPDEPMAESACIKNYLIRQGISEDRIMEENRSESTFENMEFTKDMLLGAGCDIQDTKIAFSTTKYHVFRSGLYAKRVKLDAEGMGADTKWYFWPNASVREFVGLMTEHRGKQALVLGGMIAVYAILTVLSFIY